MTTRLLTLLTCFLLLTLPSAAQQPTYRLKIPTATEYLQVVLEFASLYAAEIGGHYTLLHFHKLIELEIQLRYPNLYEQDFSLINAAYNQLSEYYSFGFNPSFWNETLVLSWIATHDISLTEAEETGFEDFVVVVTARDLNADGKNEGILDIQRGDNYYSYMVVEREDGKFRRIKTPLLNFAIDDGSLFPTVHTFTTLDFKDVNEDGHSELIVLRTSVGEYSDSGRLYILEWQDGELVDIGDQHLSFHQPSIVALPVTWEFLNLDEDASLEIEQRRQMLDNWGCQWTEITLFDWDGSLYVKTTTYQDFPETEGCTRRKAEEAMWTLDWKTAISLYKQLPRTWELTLEQIDQSMGFWDANNYNNYSDFRLATAYLLDGQVEKGIELLRALQALPEAQLRLSELVDLMLEAYSENPTAIAPCIAAYDFVMYNGYYFWDAQTANLEVGYITDNTIYGQGMYIPGPAHPAYASCNALAIISQLLASTEFSVTETPTAQLTELSIPFSYVHRMDLNDDGENEWLIWPTIIQANPILFMPVGDHYQISRPAVNGYAPNGYNRLATWHLPCYPLPICIHSFWML